MKIKIISSIISAVCLILSFPTFNLIFLAWVGFVPLLFALENVSAKKAFWLSYLCGAVFFLGTIYWLTYVTVIGYIILALYLALYFGIFGLLYSMFKVQGSRFKVKPSTFHLPPSTLFIPSLWVSLEWLRSILFTGFGWTLLGYSQYLNLPIIQIADITGVWGVSWLVIMGNVAIKKILDGGCWMIENGKWKMENGLIALPFFVILAVLIYGYCKLYPLSIIHYPLSIRVSIIQGNIPQEQKWDERYEKFIMQTYQDLTRQTLKDNPDLIIWPETAIPGFLGESGWLDTRISKFIKDDIKIPLLTGAPFINDSGVYNSAVLISEDGNIISRYDKLHLVPFGEYIPLRGLIPAIGRLGEIGDFSPGREFTVFGLESSRFKVQGSRLNLPPSTFHLPPRFSVLICFEDIFPNLSRRFVKDGAQFLVNITNDAWFGKTSAPYQHVQASVFRAVENRVPVVRAANTGLSCFIDRQGRIYQTLKDKEGSEIFMDGFVTAEINPSRQKSFYTRFGDVFAIICILVAIYGIIIALWRK